MNAPVIQFVDGPVGQIETASLLCVLAQPMPAQALLLLHPHPLHGGTMGNKVVTTIARVARDGGSPAVAFNFRGAGRSAGGICGEGVFSWLNAGLKVERPRVVP